MNTKKILLFAVIVMIAVFSSGIVSAGVFDGLDVTPTQLNVTVVSDTVEFRVCENDTPDGEIETLFDVSGKIYVNVTDENGNVESYELKLDENLGGLDNGAKLKLDPGTYTISVYYPGDEFGDYAPSSLNTTVTITEDSQPSQSGQSSASISSADSSSGSDVFDDIRPADTEMEIDSMIHNG